jgi:hypothetical protein
VTLKLMTPPGKHDSSDRGSIVIRFVASTTPEQVAAEAITGAWTAADSSGVTGTKDITESRTAIAGSVLVEVGAQASCYDTLGSLVTRLSALAAIVDEFSKVRHIEFSFIDELLYELKLGRFIYLSILHGRLLPHCIM